jgi:hypothetical protein
MTPAAGPDSIVDTARRRAMVADITPPADSMTNIGASTPIARSRVSRSVR